MGLRIGVDVGGTFTDLCLLVEETAQLRYLKVRSTPTDPSEAVLNGVEQLLAEARATAKEVRYFAHGTTVATNTLIQRRGAITGLVTTRGFRDVIELARQKRPDLFDLQTEKPVPLVPRHYCEEVRERIAYSGDVLVPLDEADAKRAIAALVEKGVQAIAICLLHSYANPEHERRIRGIVHEDFPELHVSVSHEVLREFREYERVSTTAVNAYIAPAISGYLRRLESGLERMGVGASPHISASNGGVMSVRAAAERPAAIIASGPAAGVAGAVYVSDLARRRDLLTMDIGGTSVDVSLIRGGVAQMATQTQVVGLPVKMPMIDVHSVGAGGGSVAWVDNGLLKVGPHSAGADPGPACYGSGGERATVTDAQLVLGRIGSECLLGGRLPLNPDLSARAIEREVARPLGLTVTEAARGIVAVMESNLIRALRRISVERGHDPREFALVAFGGAGPLHGAAVAQELAIEELLVPEHPGLLCAIGLLAADIRADFSRTRILAANSVEPGEMQATVTELEAEAWHWLDQEGISPTNRSLSRAVDMRYLGQNHELRVPLGNGVIDRKTVSDLILGFHQAHEVAYGHYASDEPTQMVTFRVTAIGAVPKVQPSPITRARAAAGRSLTPATRRPVYFDQSGGFVDTAIFLRDSLEVGDQVQGPAVIEQMDSTTVIPPGMHGCVGDGGNLIINTHVARRANDAS